MLFLKKIRVVNERICELGIHAVEFVIHRVSGLFGDL